MILSNSEIGARIRSTRIQRNLTLQEIADEIGVNNSTLSRYENGKFTDLKLPIIERIATVLQVNPSWLLGKVDDPTDYNDPSLIDDIPSGLLHEWQSEGLSAEEIARRWRAMDKETLDDHLKEVDEMEQALQNPDIRMIARAGTKMTPEQAEKLRAVAMAMFPEAFT